MSVSHILYTIDRLYVSISRILRQHNKQSTLFSKEKICVSRFLFFLVKILNEVAKCQGSHNCHINKDSTAWKFSDCGSIWKSYKKIGDYFLGWAHGCFTPDILSRGIYWFNLGLFLSVFTLKNVSCQSS